MAELSTLGAVVKTAYEAEADTNAFTDTEKAKLNAIEAGADVTDATNVAAAGAVMATAYDANTLLVANSDNTPTALSVPADTLVGRASSGVITALTASAARTVLNVANGAIADIVNDTSPQLGGDLDVNSRSIVSVSNGNINITPNGSGAVVLDGIRWPTALGTSGQFLRTDGAGVSSWATVSGGGGGGVGDLIYPYVFEASDTTGASDVTSELETLLTTAAGAPVFIPQGRYLINSLDVDVSVDLWLSSNAVIVFNYALDNRSFWVRNEDAATLAATISAITDVTWFHGERVTRITLSSVTGYAKGDVVHIHSQDGWLEDGADDRRIGQSSKVADIDTVNNYLYLYTRLELGSLMTSTPRIRKYTDRTFSINGGIFEANGDYDDATLMVQANRRAAVEIYATPRVSIKNVTFRKLWAQGLILKNCPYSIVENCKFEKLVNLYCPGGSSGTGTVLTITGITKANPGVVTVSAATGLSNGDEIFIWNVGGMTEVNNRAYKVKNLSGSTFQLEDWWGDGDVTTAVNTSSFGTYTSGGSVSETDVNGLGYGVQIYASSCFTTVKGCVFEECRHCVTSDAIQDSSYNDVEWATYGLPTNVTVMDCVSYNAHGIPYDLHEEGYNWRFVNCHAIYPSRGPEFQDSYYGVGFQDRATNSAFLNCSVYGGAWGLRVSPSDAPVPSRTIISNCDFRNLRSKSSEDGYGIRLLPEISYPPFRTTIMINDCVFDTVQTGIQTDGGATARIIASGLKFVNVDELMDFGPGTEFVAVDRITADFRENIFATNHYCIRMRSTTSRVKQVSISSGSRTVTGIDSTAALAIVVDAANVNTGTDVITYTSHPFNTGTQVTWSATSGSTLPAGISSGTTYYINDASANTFKLYDTYANAVSGGGTGLINITTSGTGTFNVVTLPFVVGMYVEGTGIPTGTRILSIDSTSQMTLDVAATATSSTTQLTVCPSSTALLMGGLTLIGEPGHMPAEVFYQSDTTQSKYYYIPTNTLVQNTAGATAATVLMSGATTLIQYPFITVT